MGKIPYLYKFWEIFTDGSGKILNLIVVISFFKTKGDYYAKLEQWESC